MEFLDPQLDEYVVQYTQNESELLNDLNRQTHLKVLNPRMIAGAYQGRVLSMLSHMVKPRRILEIGTYTGYSAICLSEGLADNGMIDTIEVNEELEEMILDYFSKAGVKDKINLRIGNAIEVIKTLDEEYDMVFIDADKENYLNYYNLVFDKVRPGGYIIADNVLWSGKVLDSKDDMDIETQALVEYSKTIKDDNRVENVLFAIRDGIMIARKL